MLRNCMRQGHIQHSYAMESCLLSTRNMKTQGQGEGAEGLGTVQLLKEGVKNLGSVAKINTVSSNLNISFKCLCTYIQTYTCKKFPTVHHQISLKDYILSKSISAWPTLAETLAMAGQWVLGGLSPVCVCAGVGV